MYQLVNLYQPVLKKQPKLLSASTLLIINFTVMCLLAALYLNARSTLGGLQRTSDELALSHTQLDVRLRSIHLAQSPHGQKDSAEMFNQLQVELDNRNALLEHIDHLFTVSGSGFGDVFESLAKASVPGLWLTGIQLDDNGGIEISGTALDPKLVPHYLQVVTRYTSLASLDRSSVSLLRDNSNTSVVNFVLNYIPQSNGS